MLTPADIKHRTLKTTMGGYNKKDTDEFLASILESFEQLQSENTKLKEQLTSLSEGIQYYKNLEDNLQKALVLAEKTSEETKTAAKAEAANIVSLAKTQANDILSQAKDEAAKITENAKTDIYAKNLEMQKKADTLNNKLSGLVSSYEDYKKKIKLIVEKQLEFIENEEFSPEIPEYEIPEYILSNENNESVNTDISNDEAASCENEDTYLNTVESELNNSKTIKLEDNISTDESINDINTENKIFKWESNEEVDAQDNAISENKNTLQNSLQNEYQASLQNELQNELQSKDLIKEGVIDNVEETDDIVVENIMTTPTLDGMNTADISNTVFPASKPENDSVPYLSEKNENDAKKNPFTFIDLD